MTGIRRYRPEDRAAVEALNEANRPEVGVLDAGRIDLFARAATTFDVVEGDGEIVGLFVGLTEGLDYDSPNYRWFAARHSRFAYVDRIAMHEAVRGTGVADDLYRRFFAFATGTGRPVVCAEVNTVPRNERSLRFHDRLGFHAVSEIAPYGGDERVVMLERHQNADGPPGEAGRAVDAKLAVRPDQRLGDTTSVEVSRSSEVP